MDNLFPFNVEISFVFLVARAISTFLCVVTPFFTGNKKGSKPYVSCLSKTTLVLIIPKWTSGSFKYSSRSLSFFSYRGDISLLRVSLRKSQNGESFSIASTEFENSHSGS